jgi:signal transduction histidine kinase
VVPLRRRGRRPSFVFPLLWIVYALLQFLALTGFPAYAMRAGIRSTPSPVDNAICQFLARQDCGVLPSVTLLALANIAGGLLLVQEVWRRYHTETSLQQLAAQSGDSQKLVHFGTWRWHAATDSFHLNSSSRHILSLNPERDVSLEAFAGTFLSEDGSSLANLIREAAKFSRGFSRECRVAKPGHVIEWAEITGHASGQDCAGYVIDITQRKQLESERNRIREQLSFYSQASSVLMHELKQPLAAILGNAEAARRMLKNDNVNAAELAAAIRDIIQEDNRASDVIKHMKSFFHHDDMTVALEGIIRESTKIMHVELVKRDIELQMNIHDKVPYVTGDPVQIQQVLLNLIGNAVDALEGKREGAKIIAIDLSFNSESNFVTIAISDTGTGIPENVRRRLFSPYFTTKGKGTGLGLYICRSVIAAHGGRISAMNNADGGATFYVQLPKGLSDAVWQKARTIQSS